MLISKLKSLGNILIVNLIQKKDNVHISLRAEIHDTFFEGDNLISDRVKLKQCRIGKMTYFANGSEFSYSRFGRYCSIGQNCKVLRGEHPTSVFVSTSPAFFDKRHKSIRTYVSKTKFDDYKFLDEEKKYCLEIGNDVWLASDVRIVEGVRIGDGAVVCAGAVVTDDVPPYAIVGGVPAKVIKYRFNEEQIRWLQQLKWWNKEDSWIRTHADEFENIEKLQQSVMNSGGQLKG